MKKKILLAAVLSLFFPVLAFAQQIDDPLKNKLGANATVIDMVTAALAGFAALFGVFAFGFLIISGFKMIIARDNQESATIAKQGIWWSVWGFVIAILSFSLISSVHTLFGGTGTSELNLGGNLKPPVAQNEFMDVFQTVLNGILGISALVAVLMICYAGFRMIFSAGNDEQLTSAKTILKWATLGLVIIVLSFSILNGINKILMNQGA